MLIGCRSFHRCLPTETGEGEESHRLGDPRAQYPDIGALAIGRRLFDLTNGWGGKPAAGDHVFVVTHEPPANWEFAGTAPFTFVDGVEAAISAAQDVAGDRIGDVAAGQIGGQALRLGLIDQIVVNLVPVVFGSGQPFFATGSLADPILLDNPSPIVRGGPCDAPRL